MVLNNTELANVDSMLETKLVGDPSLGTLAQTHVAEISSEIVTQ